MKKISEENRNEERDLKLKSEELSKVTGGTVGVPIKKPYIKITNDSGCLIWVTISSVETHVCTDRFPLGQSKTIELSPDDTCVNVLVQSDGVPDIYNVVEESVWAPCCIEYRIKGTLFKMSYQKIEHSNLPD